MKTKKTFNTVSNYKDLLVELNGEKKGTRIMLVSLTPADARDIIINQMVEIEKHQKRNIKNMLI